MNLERIKRENFNINWAAEKRPSQALFEKAMEHCLTITRKNTEEFAEKFMSACGVNGRYIPVENADMTLCSDWTSSFFTGMLWLAYEYSGEEKFKLLAKKHTQSFRERLKSNDMVDHHDVGFLYILSAVADYKVTGDEKAKQLGLCAADKLLTRFREKIGIFQQNGNLQDLSSHMTGRFIIDCSMNVPLLYWATSVTGNESYAQKATIHMNHMLQHLVRDSAGTYQAGILDIETGAVKKLFAPQGAQGDNACWSRGQAWGIYGLSLLAEHTGCTAYLDVAKKLSIYFLNRLPSDRIANWDLLFTADNDQRDSSAAAIAVCGLLELSKQLPVYDPDRNLLESAALCILGSLTENYLIREEDSNALLRGGVYSMTADRGVNEPCIWGDYFYMEALMRVLKPFRLYW